MGLLYLSQTDMGMWHSVKQRLLDLVTRRHNRINRRYAGVNRDVIYCKVKIR